ncbi:MAG: 3,4-dihydroxy-2-butanone-4-phosphate synthase, partial [Candidatus Nitrosothermus koennekii]
EMLDDQTYEALSIEKAREYGAKHNIMLISADEVREYLRLNIYEQ